MQTITQIYKSYKENTDTPLDKALFKEICEEFNISLIDTLLEGNVFQMKHNLASLSIRRIERNPSSPTIDWWESNKYKQELLAEGILQDIIGGIASFIKKLFSLCSWIIS